MFVFALAYVGTGDNKVIKQLLHFAVSDVNDDVRRAAVIALGFVLFRNHTQVPRVVQLLAESYNPHVRHGATLALGISCAGTGLAAAIDLLEPMTRDPVDFVRQGAYIALAMILIQQTEAQAPKVTQIRELFAKVVAEKHEDPMARFGASLAQGIIDAGGRNMTISLATRAGTPDMKSIVGMALFVQFWYWFPLAHFLGLTFSPTTMIALDGKGRIPKVDFVSWAKPSMFDYPMTEKPVTEEKKKKAKAAVLSTTHKAQARAKSKKAEQGEAMDTDDKPEDEEDTKETKETKTTEAGQSIVHNMTRITPSQLPFVTGPYDPIATPEASTSGAPPAALQPKKGRYTPVRSVGDGAAFASGKPADGRSRVGWSGNVLMLADSSEEDGEYIELDAALWPRGAPEPEQPAAEPEAVPRRVAPSADMDWDGAMPDAFEYEFED
jgi:26S proteasome regulatory subunit N2